MSSGNLEKYINNYLISSYTLDTPFYFRNGVYSDVFDLPPTFIVLPTGTVTEKPANNPYISYRIVDGPTINVSLGGGNEKVKSENVSLEFTIFRPKDTSKKKTNEIEEELDRIFLNADFSELDYEIISDTLNPKASVNIPASGNDIESIKQLQYRFDYRFL